MVFIAAKEDVHYLKKQKYIYNVFVFHIRHVWFQNSVFKRRIEVPRDVQNSKSENMTSLGENGLSWAVSRDSFSLWTWARVQTARSTAYFYGCPQILDIVTPTDRPKSVRNRYVIEVFGGVFVIFTLLLGLFCGCRGFCHRTESDLFLFLLMWVYGLLSQDWVRYLSFSHNIRTSASPKVREDQMFREVRISCRYATPVANVQWEPLSIG